MPRRTNTCYATGRTFEPGEEFKTFLYEINDGGYERRDYTLDLRPPSSPPWVASWRARRPPPAEKTARKLDRAALYTFFKRLQDDDSAEKIQFRFVLALLLWRRKVLKFKASETVEGNEFWDFIEPKAQDRYRVLKPALDDAETETLSAQIEDLLSDMAAGGAIELPDSFNDELPTDHDGVAATTETAGIEQQRPAPPAGADAAHPNAIPASHPDPEPPHA